MSFSVIVPVFENPTQVDELLTSLVGNLKHCGHYTEVIVVDDGSTNPCEEVCAKHYGDLLIKYYMIPHSGVTAARNFAVKQSVGEYIIFLDSDVIVPPGYLQAVLQELYFSAPDAFGGPEKTDKSFSSLGRAFTYALTSPFSLGALYGSESKMSVYYPRAFNMGIRRDVFDSLGGFTSMTLGEDLDLMLRIIGEHKSCRRFPNAWVYHKRKEKWKSFIKKAFASGEVCAMLSKLNPESNKVAQFLNLVLTPLLAFLLLLSLIHPIVILPVLAYFLLLVVNATIVNKNLVVGVLSAIATFVYGSCFGTGYLLTKIK